MKIISPNKIATYLFISELQKAYREGVYANTPKNKKLGRIGMTYSLYHFKLQTEEDIYYLEKEIKDSKRELSNLNNKLRNFGGNSEEYNELHQKFSTLKEDIQKNENLIKEKQNKLNKKLEEYFKKVEEEKSKMDPFQRNYKEAVEKDGRGALYGEKVAGSGYDARDLEEKE